ncbi:MAG: response regulator [Gemmatimonadaceae bacterium]|nr:response regulator [Gemmatimonadaceae bacterium]
MVDVATQDGAASHRVLLIDDELTIRLALRRFFTRMGWRVDEATNGESGYSMIVLDGQQTATPPYDVIISDLRMPGLNGIQLHDRLKTVAPEVLDRLIFSTGDIVSQEAAEFVNSSACVVLQKPFELATLRETIERVMHHEPQA